MKHFKQKVGRKISFTLTLYFMYLYYIAIMKLSDLPNLFNFMSHPLLKQLYLHEATKIYIYHHSAIIFEPVHEISNNVVCATSKASDQPAHMRSLIRAFASRLSIL